MKPQFILIIGESESGKSLLAKHLSEKYNIPMIESYTTRPRRHPKETGHTFVSLEEYQNTPKSEIIAETCFGGQYYYATKDQVKDTNIYIVDEKGYLMLRDKYTTLSLRVSRIVTKESSRRKRDNFVLPYDTFSCVVFNNGTKDEFFERADEIVGKYYE